jgi:hypothetical protein
VEVGVELEIQMAREFSPALVLALALVLFLALVSLLVLVSLLALDLALNLALNLALVPSPNLLPCFLLDLVWPVFGDFGRSLRSKSIFKRLLAYSFFSG